MGVILLINMMIALLSNTYTRVEVRCFALFSSLNVLHVRGSTELLFKKKNQGVAQSIVSLQRYSESRYVVNGDLIMYAIVDDNTKRLDLVLNNLSAFKDNSLKEWSFKKAIRIQTYSTYDPIPVPFNLISSLLSALRSLWRCLCCCLDRNNGNVSNELDWVIWVRSVKTHNYKLHNTNFIKTVH